MLPLIQVISLVQSYPLVSVEQPLRGQGAGLGKAIIKSATILLMSMGVTISNAYFNDIFIALYIYELNYQTGDLFQQLKQLFAHT